MGARGLLYKETSWSINFWIRQKNASFGRVWPLPCPRVKQEEAVDGGLKFVDETFYPPVDTPSTVG
jgi:hypothetical protein